MIGIAGTIIGALVSGALATRAKVSEEMRQVRLVSYPLLWQLTSCFARWPRMTNSYSDLESFHTWFRSWYYEAGGWQLSENSRARYGDVQELVAAELGTPEGGKMPKEQPPGPLLDSVYKGLMEACSELRTALTEDLESRRQRSILYRIRLARRHEHQKRKAKQRVADAKEHRKEALGKAKIQWQPQASGR